MAGGGGPQTFSISLFKRVTQSVGVRMYVCTYKEEKVLTKMKVISIHIVRYVHVMYL